MQIIHKKSGSKSLDIRANVAREHGQMEASTEIGSVLLFVDVGIDIVQEWSTEG